MKKDLLSVYELETTDFDIIWKKAARLKNSSKKEKNMHPLKEKRWG